MLLTFFPTIQSKDTNRFDAVVPGQDAHFIEKDGSTYWLNYRGSRWRGIPSSQRIFLPGDEVVVHGLQGNRLIFS